MIQWSEEQLNILKNEYPLGGVKGCIDKGLKVSEPIIRKKAKELGLNYVNKKYGRHWSDEELNILKNNYKNGLNVLYELLPNKSEPSIKKKLIVMGLKIKGWSDKELDIVRTYYEDGGYILCQEKGVNKSEGMIKDKAKEFGLTYNYRNLWSVEEDNILIKYYIEGGVRLCQEKGLNRTGDSIRHRAICLNLTNKDLHQSWTDEELNIVKRYYKEGGTVLCREKGLDRSKFAIYIKARQLGVYMDINYWSTEEDNIVKTYYEQGGPILCKEKGLNRSDSAIYSRALKYNLKPCGKG